AYVGEAVDHRRPPLELDALRGYERPELLASGPLEQHLHALHMAMLFERANEALAMLRVCVEGFHLNAQGGGTFEPEHFAKALIGVPDDTVIEGDDRHRHRRGLCDDTQPLLALLNRLLRLLHVGDI